MATILQALLFDKISNFILVKYFNYNNILLIKNTMEFLKQIGINNYVIKLKKSK